ncbi:MAG: bifunctional glutamate N-acetyltransferase/amino-acid acetyltransferase ArgJ [Pseudomonadota bacterium]
MVHAVAGVRLASVYAGIKQQTSGSAPAPDETTARPDLVLMRLAAGSQVAGVFTQSHFAAPPVLICRDVLAARTPVDTLVINSGNANAATGDRGRRDAEAVCDAARSPHGQAVLPFSTGVIGEFLPVAAMRAALAAAAEQLSTDGWVAAAEAIMTTDTVAKLVSRTLEVNGKRIAITGMAKGSGMIEPNMATMLAFLACDAPVPEAELRALCQRIADRSFNRVSVDGDTSTNDAFVLVATGAGETVASDLDTAALAQLEGALTDVAIDLAMRIARDGEGATRLVRVAVAGAATDDDAHRVAKTLANSPLLKTAIFAGDPNWGRLCMAIGRAPAAVTAERVAVFLESAAGRLCVARHGMVAEEYSEAQASAIMAEPELSIDVELGLGGGATTVWTCDLSYDYVRINAEYRT